MRSKQTILIADDDPTQRKLLTYELTKIGYKVLIASNGLEAINWLRSPQPRPDLVLLDLLMPRFSGLDVLEMLKASSSKLPVILMSAAEWPIVRHSVNQLVPDAFMVKPFDLQNLLAKIETLLHNRLEQAD
ncbi:response regulator [Larkinella bovis]|uniref:Response regulator n=1 Tax=Larkinella bovis TaxID=683041 RepID=A0ABW0I9U4_9BACT